MSSLSVLKTTTRAALFGTTALVASASGAQAIDYIVNATETSTFILGLGTSDSLAITGSGEITSVSPGVAVIDLADSITVESTGVTAEIDADAVGIEVQGITADLTGGISIASGAIVTATTNGGGSNDGTGILVRTGADISGGVNNSGAITGYDYGIKIENSASISGSLVNSGSIYGSAAAIGVGDSPAASATMGAITNSATGVIGVNASGGSVAGHGIRVRGSAADITSLITNHGAIAGGAIALPTPDVSATAIVVIDSADISGGITNTGAIGEAPTSATSVVSARGIRVSSAGNISGTITNSGTVIGADTAILVTSASITGGIVNSGNITGGTDSTDAAIRLNAGTLGSTANIGIANQTGGVISGFVAVDINAGSTVYGITNSGEIFSTGGLHSAIDARLSQFNGDITNNIGGIIGANAAGTSADAHGIYFSITDSTGDINNSGNIVGSSVGIHIASSSALAGAITNATSGSIGLFSGATSNVSAATGILVRSTSSVAGGIVNSGNIVGTARGVLLSNGASVGTAATGSAPAIAGIVNNSLGVISAGATGIRVINSSSVLGGISNSGRIYGADNAILLTNSAAVSSITNNSGGIIGESTGGGSDATYGISIRASATVSGGISNSGTIQARDAAIHVDAATVAGGITNDGVMRGDDVGIFLVNGASIGTAATGPIPAIIGISNQVGGVITGSSHGVEIRSATVLGGISNSGKIYGGIAAIDVVAGGEVAGITNTGIIGTSSSGSSHAVIGIEITGAGSTVSGDIDNSGTLIGTSFGLRVTSQATVVGNIVNNVGGMIGLTAVGGTVTASAAGISFGGLSAMTGNITNSGTIFGGSTGLEIGGNSDLTGNITNNSGGLIGVTASGSAASYAGIRIHSASDVVGSISNAGTIFGGQYGIEVTGTLSVGITNTGLIGVSSSNARATAAGIRIQGGTNLSSGLFNSGTVFGGVVGLDVLAGASIGSDITNTGRIGVTTSGAVASSAGIRIHSGTNVNGSLINSGTIVGAQYGVRVHQGSDIEGISNTGLIGVTASGAAATATGLQIMSGPSLSSGITNTGTIFGDQYAIRAVNGAGAGAVTNNTGGQIGITASGATATVGIYLGSGGSITTLTNNSGIIAGQDAAIQVSAGGNITGGISNIGGGTIIGQVYGIEIKTSVALGGAISNSGLIEGRANSAIYMGDAYMNGTISNDDRIIGGTIGIHFDDGILSGSIDNSGRIEGGDEGIRLESNALLQGGIVNISGGVIEGYTYGIRIDGSSQVVGSISNGGIILSDSSSGTGILVTNNSTVGSITNSGTIQGGTSTSGYGIYVSANSSVTSITNSGTIEGETAAIQFSNNDSTLTLQTDSSLIGDVDGGTGANDTLVLEGRGSENSTFTNFENLTVSASTSQTWNLFAAASVDAITVNSGTLDLRGAFTVATSATVAGGTLSVASGGSLLVPIIAATGGSLDIAGTVTVSGGGGVTVGETLNVSNTGVLLSTTIDVTGDMDVAGSVTATGDLNVGGALGVASGGILSAQDDLDVTGDLDVSGAIHVSGKATVGGLINVASSASLIIDEELETQDLDVDGTISATDIMVSGTLSGSGTITGDVTVGGILSPGNSPGTLVVVGSFVESANSTYLVEHAAGVTDKVEVTGAALIDTNVDVNVSVGAGTDGFVDDILTATLGITGTYDEVTGLDDNVVGLIVYPDANTATLLVAKTDTLVATVGTVSDAGFTFLDNLQEGARRDGRVWATGYIYNAENEGQGQAGADYDQDAFGFNAGVDVISQSDLKIGVAVGYLDGDVDIDSSTSEAENDALFGAAYLNYMNDDFYLDGALMVGQQTIDTSRTLSAGTATASVDATSYGANLEAGFELEALGGRLSPFVKVGIHSASLDAYSESGAAGAMTVGEVETQQMRVGGGFRYAVDLGSEDGIQVTPALKVGMTQEWQDTDSSADIGFVGYTGSTTAALDFKDQTTIDLGLRFDVKLSQAVTAFVGWDAALGDETTRNTGTIGLSVNW